MTDDPIPDNPLDHIADPVGDRIIAALGHDDFFVRSAALSHLEQSANLGIDVTRGAMAAIDRYGHRGAFEYPHQIGSLCHDGESLTWALDMAGTIEVDTGVDTFPFHLANWVANAPVSLFTSPVLTALQGLPCYESAATPHATATRRLELASKSAEECVTLIDEGAATAAARAETDDFPHEITADLKLVAERFAAAATREEVADRALGWIRAAGAPDLPSTAAEWQAGVAIQLAGLISLDVAIPEMVGMLKWEWDWWDEGIAKAIVAMGSEAALSKVIEHYPGGDWHVRNYLSGVLEKLRFPGFEDEIMRLAEWETDDDLWANLGVALASFGTEEAMAQAHLIYADFPEDGERFYITQILYMHRIMLGEDSATLRSWRKQYASEHERSLQTRQNIFSNPQQSQQSTVAKILQITRSETNRVTEPIAAKLIAAKSTVGRNDPCTCGSGKKFKKCCLNKHR